MFSAYNAAATKIQGHSLRATVSVLFPQGEPSEGLNVLEEPVLLVDIGAGRGQVLREVRKGRPDLVGRMIAQDLPEVIAGREVVEGVENMVFNFFEPQPIKGVYLFHSRISHKIRHPDFSTMAHRL